jgi:hypothetical protein
MASDGSPFAVLAQQGAEAANLVVAEKSVGVPWRKPSISDNDQERYARSEAASSVSPNHRLSEHDAWCRITQNRTAWDYGRDRDDLHNIIEDQGVSSLEHHPHHNSLYRRTSFRWEKLDSVLWRDHSDKSGGHTNSRLVTSTSMMALVTLKSLFRYFRLSSRPPEETIRSRPIFCPRH